MSLTVRPFISLAPVAWLVITALAITPPTGWARPASAEPAPERPVDESTHPEERFSADSQAINLSEAFRQAGKDFFPEDRVVAFPDPALGLGTVVTVRRALPVVVNDGRNRLAIRTWQTTVGAMLKEKRINLGADDLINPSMTSQLLLGSVITITRVARTETTENESIAFQTIKRDDPDTFWPNTRVITVGQNGLREKKYLLIREDGELVSKTLLANTVAKPAVNKVIGVGTKLKIGQTLTGQATWYDCCGTKVASDAFRRGTNVRVSNLASGKQIIVKIDGCICGASNVLIDLHPSLFTQLGGRLGQGVFSSVRVEEILN